MRGPQYAVIATVGLIAASCGDHMMELPDARRFDARVVDAPLDAAVDAPVVDAMIDGPLAPDAGPADAGPPDAPVVPPDGRPDAAIADARPADASPPDAAPPPDASPPDATPPPDAAPDATPPPDAAPDATPPPDADYTCTIPPFTLGVSTLAGCDVPAAVDGPRDVARFHNPVNVAVSPDGFVYVADFDNDRIRRVTPSGGVTTLIHEADFRRPFGLAFAPDGTLYAETDDDPGGAHSAMTGTIWRVDTTAGTATPIIADIGRPRGMAVLPSGLIVLADYVHHVVRLLDPTSGAMSTLAGAFDQPGYVNANGPDARFDGPYGVAVMLDGSIAVADYNNSRIRRITLIGNVSLLAGDGTAGWQDGAAATAEFSQPQDLAVDAAGRLYVADAGNYVVRRIDSGVVDTVVGDGAPGYLDSDDLRAAELFGLEGLDISPLDGMLVIADGSRGEDANPHHRIRTAILP